MMLIVAFAALPAVAAESDVLDRASAAITAEQALKAGRQALDRNDLREAYNQFRAAAMALPDSEVAQDNLGWAAENLGELDEALGAYRAAARLAQSADRIVRAASLAGRMGQADAARAELEANQGSLPDDAVAQYLFRLYVEVDDRAKALAFARSRGWVREGADYCGLPVAGLSTETLGLLALLLHPARADCLVQLGTSLYQAGFARLSRQVLSNVVAQTTDATRRDQAAAFLRARLPGHDVGALAESLNILGYRLQHRWQRPADAFNVYQKAIAADPAFSWPYSNIGTLYADRGQWEDARQAFRRATVVNPDHAQAQRNVGLAAFQLGRNEEAVDAFRRALALVPDDAGAQALLGRALLRLGRPPEAIAAFQAALALNPGMKAERELLNTLGNREPMIEELLELSGLKRQLAQLPAQLRALLGQRLQEPLQANPDATQVLNQAFAPDTLLAAVKTAFLADFDHASMSAVLAFLRTPLARTMTRLGEQAGQPGFEASAQAFAHAFKGSPAELERASAISQLDDATGATNDALDLVMTLDQSIARVLNPVLPLERRITAEAIEGERQARSQMARTYVLAALLFMYQSASAADIARYAEFWRSESGRWFLTAQRTAVLGAIGPAAERATLDIFRTIAAQKLGQEKL